MRQVTIAVPDRTHRLSRLAARESGIPLSRWIAQAMEHHYLRQALQPGWAALAEAIRAEYPEPHRERSDLRQEES